MSRLIQRKSKLKFETANVLQGRAVVVEAQPHYLRVRLKGQRTAFEVSYSSIYYLGARVAADMALAQKRTQRKLQQLAKP